MATADKLNRVLQTKTDIKNAMNSKGMEVNDSTPFSEYSSIIEAVKIPNKTSDLTNDGSDGTNLYIDKNVNNLTNYTLTSSLSTVATSGNYNDLSNKPTFPSTDNFAPKNHTHDDRYYTESEINNKLTDYATESFVTSRGYITSSGSITGNAGSADYTTSLKDKDTGRNAKVYFNNYTLGGSIAVWDGDVSHTGDSNITLLRQCDYGTFANQMKTSMGLSTVATSGKYSDLSGKPTNALIDLTGQLQYTSYRKSVIALCEISESANSANNSYSMGTLYFHRVNGLQTPVSVNINIEDSYSGAKSVNANYIVMADGVYKNYIYPCIFKYNNKWYGGLHFFVSDAELGYITFVGSTSFNIFGLDYADTRSGQPVLNNEVNSSLTQNGVNLRNGLSFNGNLISGKYISYDDTFKITGSNSNEINFPSLAHSRVYFGYRALDGGVKPTEYVFGNSNDTSTSVYAGKMYNGGAGDYAECFDNTNLIYKDVLHRIVEITDNAKVQLSTGDNEQVIGIVSDNYGHIMGGTEQEIQSSKKIPVGLAGTLYVDTKDRLDKKNLGKFVIADKDGYCKKIEKKDKNKVNTIVGKIIDFDFINNRYKVLLILK